MQTDIQVKQIERRGLFQNTQISDGHTGEKVTESEKRGETGAIRRGSAPQLQAVTYMKPDQGAGIEEIQMQAATKDAVQMKNEMVVGVNKSSTETVQGMEEDGFSLDSTDIQTIVTETDKIQMELAKAGKDTSYFTGELSAEQLEAMTGSAALAAQYESAIHMAEELKPLTDGSLKYMLENKLEPTIQNLYYAQYNGVESPLQRLLTYNGEDGLQEQYEKVIKSAGLDVTQKRLSDCNWMVTNGIAVTVEHVKYLEELQGLSLPMTTEELLPAMAQSVAEGKLPADAYVLEDYTPIARAREAQKVIIQATDRDLRYVLEQGKELTIANLQEAHTLIESGAVVVDESDGEFSVQGLSLLEARRVLEETRLIMSAEANYSLIKRGMNIELEPLEKLVEDLKAQEQYYHRQLLEADGSHVSTEQVELFKETLQTAEMLKTMPAYAIGSIPRAELNAAQLYENGAQIQQKLSLAGEAYETMMTTPQAALGDSIQKAFRNVTDILQEIGMEPTEENARAVRILAYNQLEIEQASVTEMKLADRQVQDAFNSLKPAVVREMIRQGINPLQMPLEELNAQAAQIRTEIGGADDMTKYSEYLWKLEHNHEISAKERDAYIGIYRLIHQVEAGDGAAIGALVEQGAPLTMGNLLRAMRSEKKSGMNYQVDQQFQGVEAKPDGSSISAQIEQAFQTSCFRRVQELAQEPEQFSDLLSRQNWEEMTPEQLLREIQNTEQNTQLKNAYDMERLQELQQAAAASGEVYEMLDTYSMPVTVSNVLAMQQMMANPNDALRRFFRMTEEIEQMEDIPDEKSALMDEIAEIKQKILHELGKNMQTPKELADAQQTLAEVAEHCGQTVMYAKGMSRLNIKQLQMMTTQLHLGVRLTKEERYQIPVMTSDGAVGVQVRIVRGTDKKGCVRIMTECAAYGKVAAELQAQAKGIKGYLVSDSREGVDRLRAELPRLDELLSEMQDETDLHVMYHQHVDLVNFELAGGKSTPPQDEQLREIQTKELYEIAEKMIQFFREGITESAEDADINS